MYGDGVLLLCLSVCFRVSWGFLPFLSHSLSVSVFDIGLGSMDIYNSKLLWVINNISWVMERKNKYTLKTRYRDWTFESDSASPRYGSERKSDLARAEMIST